MEKFGCGIRNKHPGCAPLLDHHKQSVDEWEKTGENFKIKLFKSVFFESVPVI
jgi:hypothetical protein